jgi:hypothetical protein
MGRCGSEEFLDDSATSRGIVPRWVTVGGDPGGNTPLALYRRLELPRAHWAGRGRCPRPIVQKGGLVSKLVAIVLAMGWLSFGGPVEAQDNGSGDPLGLIGFAAIQPFWSSGENFTIIEVTSPVAFNTGLHGVFFDAGCRRDQSVSLPVTQNGILLFTPDHIGISYDGLAVIASTANQIDSVPIDLIHTRAHWANFANDHLRVVDPISVAAAESTSPMQTWNPLRTGASWINPREDLDAHTTIFLVCPSSAVTDEIPPSRGFPSPPPIAFGATKETSSIVGVIYDDAEVPLRNIQVPCVCLTPLPVLTINSVYGNLATSPHTGQFYTEIFSLVGRSFTGYRNVVVTSGAWPGGQRDEFGRLHNGSASAYTRPGAPLSAR